MYNLLEKNPKMTILAIIPARGGSKGIPGKNLAGLYGKPLISYTINSALNSVNVDRIFVSTDNDAIRDTALKLGAEVPFVRPTELATDVAPMIDVLKHVLSWYQSQSADLEALILLQPTSPFRTSKHIDDSVDLFRSRKADSVVSVVEVPHQFNPTSVMRADDNGFLVIENGFSGMPTRRQDKPKFYARNGPSVLVCSPDIIKKGSLYGDRCFPYLMSPEDSLDIDYPNDLVIAENILKNRARF
jgi:CMP-N-acetylneuraminic acid synthetase